MEIHTIYRTAWRMEYIRIADLYEDDTRFKSPARDIFHQHKKFRKDVEWAFGVLQKLFEIVRIPARSWKPER